MYPGTAAGLERRPFPFLSVLYMKSIFKRYFPIQTSLERLGCLLNFSSCMRSLPADYPVSTHHSSLPHKPCVGGAHCVRQVGLHLRYQCCDNCLSNAWPPAWRTQFIGLLGPLLRLKRLVYWSSLLQECQSMRGHTAVG